MGQLVTEPNSKEAVIGTEENIKRKKYWAMVWKRLRSNKGALLGAGILLVFILLSLFAPFLAPYPVEEMKMENRFLPPMGEHWLGTDEFGRDILSRIMHGGRVSLMMGLVAVSIAGIIGVALGVVSGYYRKLDIYIMQVMDILLAFPSLLLAIAIIAVLGVGLTNAMIAVAISVIPSYVRVVRGAVLSIREKEYIEAVRALGISDFKIIWKHILPNVLSPVIVLSTLQFGTSILAAASLSFLGLGAQPPTPEWGAMAYVGKSFLLDAWWMSLFPGLAIMLVVLGFNLLGDGLRDALDPRIK